MTSNIKLYIGDKLVEFNKQPDIFYNWTETDLSNPITTKNSFSKTITIEGTKVNNDIFGHFWNLERYQKNGGDTGVYFNPSYKVPFTLYINGNLFEKGYVKLEKINKTGNHLKYEVGLFGGLGSFLYNLSTNFEDGSVKTLGNLKYYDNNDEELDLDFTISRDTVKEAWDNIMNDNSKWSTINFGSFYTGIPDEIDTNKVLINVSGYPNIIKEQIVSGNTYQTYAGWSMGELDNNLNQFEVKDLRSYLQTPLIRVKSIFDSLCKPINSKGEYDNGYELVLDTEFFNDDNPYYANTYMTLPQIPKLNFNLGGSGSSEYVVNDFTTLRKSRNNEGNTRYLNFELPQAISNSGGKVKLTLKPRVWVSDPDDGGQVSITPLYLMKQWISNFRYQGENRHGYAVQVYSVSDTDPATSIDTQTVLTGSSVYWYTAMDMTGSPFLYSQAGATPVVTGTDIKSAVGYWDHIEDGPTSADPSKYGFLENNGGITIETDVPAGTKQVRVWFRMYSETNTNENVIYQNNNSSANNHYSFPDIRLAGHDSDWAGLLEVVDYGGSGSIDIENNTFYSYKRITKEALLNTSYSVADWLMSYCKMFGLYIYKDSSEDKIYITTRNLFYDRNKVQDLTGLIDTSKGVTINPIYMDSKFITLTTPLEKSTYSEQYKNSYGVDYGMKKVDTGFAFNSDCKELIKTSLKGAVDCNKQSIYNFKSIDGINPYVFNGFKQTLYKNGLIYTGETENPTIEYDIPKRKISSVYKNKAYNTNYPYYDIMQHVCLENDEKPIATENVLVFYNGKKNVTDAEYYLTDDMTVMNTLNNKPCWVMTKSEYNNNIKFCNRIFNLPFFSRYMISTESTTGSSRPDMVLMSLDFGAVREVYVPNLVTDPNSNLYSKYYGNYYSDLYDINTKVLECYIKPEKILTSEDMRYFYWFKNGIWRLNQITDYNPVSNSLVKCQFIKIQDIDNICGEEPTLDITLDSYSIAGSGGTINGYVTISSNINRWVNETVSAGLTVNPVSADTSSPITVSVDRYKSYGDTPRNLTATFIAYNLSKSISISQVPDLFMYASPVGTSPFILPSTATSISYTVDCNPGCTITLYDENSTVVSSVTYTAGNYPSPSPIVIGENTGSEDRWFSFVAVSDSGEVSPINYTITQRGNPVDKYFTWNETSTSAISETIGSGATTLIKEYTSNYDNLQVTYSGCVTSATINNGSVSVNCSANPNTSVRYGTVEVKYDETVVGTFSITQQPKPQTRTIQIVGGGVEWRVNMYNQSVIAGQDISFSLMVSESMDSITGSVYGDEQTTYTAEMNGTLMFETEEMGSFTQSIDLTVNSNGPRCMIYPYQGNIYGFNQGEIGGGSGSYDTEGTIEIPAGGDTTIYLSQMTWETSE